VKKLLAKTDLLFVNKEEALAFTGATDDITALQMLVKAGVKIVCITDGARGVMATDGQKIYRCVSNSSATIVDRTWSLEAGRNCRISDAYERGYYHL
jgi:sugar/nucleoside kinase (ribokinase family)